MFLPSNITLKFGDSGDFVAELQRRLAAIDAHPQDGVSGAYDGVTVNSVSGFQSRSGLRADGIAGPETLRRLNGIVTNSDATSSSSGSNAEEEAKQLAANDAMRVAMGVQNPVGVEPIFGVAAAEAVHAAETHAAHAAVEAPQIAPPVQQPQQAATLAPGALTEQQMLQQQILRESQAHQQNNAAGDMLAQMLLQQTQQHQQTPKQEEPRVPQGHAPHQHHQATAQTPEQQAQAGAAMGAAAAEPVKGIVGRALQKMDGMLQKLSDYFEKKLPPDVMAEVKNIGLTMAQSGVKESAIPAGPEQPRAPSTPARGPDQQPQIPTRG